MNDTWTIGELAEQAADLLASHPSRSGRGRDVPNERLIRWYTTIGLLDPPLARRGRVALYGARHLLQLVAAKRRQADGRTIAEIQAELTGATDKTLSAIADIPMPSSAPAAETRERFWSARPASPALDSHEPAARESGPEPRGGAEGAGVVHGVRLAPGVTVLLDGGRAPVAADLPSLAEAAAPLLAVLAARGLAPAVCVPDEESDSTPEGSQS